MKRKYYRYLISLPLLIGVGLILNQKSPLLRYLSLSGNNSPTVVVAQKVILTRIDSLNKAAFDSRMTNPRTTIMLADSAMSLAKRANHLPGVAEAYRVTGVGFSYLENTPQSTKHYFEALKRFHQLEDHRNVARTYNNIGSLYNYSNPDKALIYFQKALKIAEDLKDDALSGGVNFNIALIYSRKSVHEQALNHFDHSYTSFKKINDTVSTALYFQNTGLVYYRLNNYDIAETRLLEAVKQASKMKLYSTLSGSYLTLSYIYMKQRRLAMAERAIEQGIKYSRMIENPVVANDFVRATYELEFARQNYPEALRFLSLAYHNDSIMLNQQQTYALDLSSRHHLQQQKIQESELLIARQRYTEAKFRWMLTLGILVLVLTAISIATLLYLREKRRRKKECIIQNNIASLEQKALQAMMNPHFVFNVMNSIQHFINQEDSKAANQVLSGFARLARKHLEICMSGTISVHEELIYLRLYLSLEKVRFSDKMNYEISIDQEIDTEEVVIPSMLVQPFIENAIWHGIMPKEGGGLVKLIFALEGDNLLITILDDGIGICNSEKSKSTSHISRGMALIRERVNLLNRLNKRHIFIDQRQTGDFGTEVLISIPA